MPNKPLLTCPRCGTQRTIRPRSTDGWRRTECRTCDNLLRKKWLLKVRAEVLSHYGGKCRCCGETEPIFLCIDHLNGNGRIHRDKVGNIYPWLRGNHYPAGYQVLCQNCNWA